MWLNLVAFGLLAAFAAGGAWRGAFRSGTGLLALIAGYALALEAAVPLSGWLAGAAEMSELLALPVAGTLAFAVGYAAVTLAAALWRRYATPVANDARSPRDRFLGGVFGTLRGGLVVLLVCWLALWLDALRQTGAESPLPAVGPSVAARVTESVVERGLEVALADAGAGGRVVARLAARPGAAVADLQHVLENPHVTALQGDAMFWSYVEHGNVDAALNRGVFTAVAYDDTLRAQLAQLAIVGPDAAEDPQAFRRDVAAVMREIGPRLRGLREDPELHALLEDPQVVAMLQSGDTVGLLRHPDFRDLVQRVTSQTRSAEPPR